MDQKPQAPRLGLRQQMRTPRAAAVAGIIFSVLLAATIVTMHLALAALDARQQDWFALNEWRLRFALHLAPLAGIAFIWFIGVLRDRLGAAEDRFFATVFWTSAVVFLAMYFVSTAVTGAVIRGLSDPKLADAAPLYAFGRTISAQLMNVYALKMAAVLMMSTATLGVRTRFIPRWISLPGYALAALLLVSSHFFDWLPLAFPLWTLMVSLYILIDNFRAGGAQPGTAAG